MSTVVSMSDTSDHAAACGPPDRQAREWRTEKFLDDVRLTGSPVGESPAWCEVLRRAIQVAATDTTTCLQGESGVGKEVVARLIHRDSPRCRGPFVAINCAALPESLFESELFGSEARRVHGSAPGEARTDRNGGGRGAVS
jgi:transcriptional regulator with PAS, ATPase and Fis domain